MGKDELDQIADSFNNNWLSMGPKVRKFEETMAELLHVPHASSN